MPELTEDQIYEFDLDKARAILDEAGYKDTDDDGVREMPGGGQPARTSRTTRAPTARPARRSREFMTGWLDEIGIATTVKVADDSQLTDDHRRGRLRHVRVGLDARSSTRTRCSTT